MDGALQFVSQNDKDSDLKNFYSAELRLSAINKFIFIIAILFILNNLIYGIIEKSNDFIITMYAAAWFSVAVFSIIVKGEGKLFYNHISEINPGVRKQLYEEYYNSGHTKEFDVIKDKHSGIFDFLSLINPFAKDTPPTIPFPNLGLWALVTGLYVTLKFTVFGQKSDASISKMLIDAILIA